MQETTKTNLHKYTFVFWLIVPVLLTWLGVNYIIGTIQSKPIWSNHSQAAAKLEVSPYTPQYSTVIKKGKGLITFWFDDAWDSQYLEAAPILKQNGFVGSIAVPTGFVGVKSYANWAQLRTLQRDGWEIDNHTVKHDCQFETWAKDRIDQELTQSTNDLWSNKLSSDIFVSPCGVDSENLRSVVNSKFIGFRGVEPGSNDLRQLDPYNLLVRNVTNETTTAQMEEWVNEAKRDDKWVIIVFHQIGTNNDANGEKYSIETDKFSELVRYVKSINIQVIIPAQALEIAKGLK